MKNIKTFVAALLAVIMLLSTFSLSTFAALPEISDITWNDDFSASFSFDGAASYSYSIYINKNMIWGYGSSNGSVSREHMLPYLTALAAEAIDRYGYSGNVSFDLKVVARDDQGNAISDNTTFSKTLNIEDVATGKLSPDTERWKYYRVDTSDMEKLKSAFYAVCDLNKAEITGNLEAQNISYDTYVTVLAGMAAEEAYFTFDGTLAQVMAFGSAYSDYAYTNVSLLNPSPELPGTEIISEVNITLTAPKAGQKIADYADSNAIKCETEGVTAKIEYDVMGFFELDTKTYQNKFYGKNEYDVEFIISFAEGYSPANNLVVKVNGKVVDWCSSDWGLDEDINGYYCSELMVADGSFFSGIATFFHNLIMKIKYPNGAAPY